MDFEEILFRAKVGDTQAMEQIVEMYRPLLVKNALVNGVFDEDLYQELMIELLKCIRYFKKLDQGKLIYITVGAVDEAVPIVQFGVGSGGFLGQIIQIGGYDLQVEYREGDYEIEVRYANQVGKFIVI